MLAEFVGDQLRPHDAVESNSLWRSTGVGKYTRAHPVPHGLVGHAEQALRMANANRICFLELLPRELLGFGGGARLRVPFAFVGGQ